MYRIRFHGRGGQGMKTAGRMLGSAFFHEGFDVQDAPRYGAERRGAPIFAYVRADRVPISERGIIRRPDLVVVADDSLVPIPAAGVLTGLSGRCVLLIDTHESAETWRRRLSLEAPIIALPAPADTADPTRSSRRTSNGPSRPTTRWPRTRAASRQGRKRAPPTGSGPPGSTSLSRRPGWRRPSSTGR